MTKHALYAIARNARTGEVVAFRVGQPVDWHRAQNRHRRLDVRMIGGFNVPRRPITVRHDGRRYTITALEVRAVDKHGRGLGSERHREALVAPFRNLRSALKGA